jgi:CRISPR-associated endonuclease Cas2
MMMTTYVLTYDLNKDETSADYKRLIDELKRLGGHRYQKSAWLLNLTNTAQEVHDHFRKLMDSNDSLWVSEFTRNYAHSRSEAGTSDWLSRNQPVR